MEWASKELLGLIYHLLPGFLAAGIVYSLTAHPKPTPFERVVQALIFTMFVQAIIIPLRELFLLVGRIHAFGRWNEDSAIVASIVVATSLGLFYSWLANTDRMHSLLRKWGITKRTSFPSEWFAFFNERARWAVLHLSGGRRLHGWIEQYPDQPDRGEFVIVAPQWLQDDGTVISLEQVDKILIRCSEVQMVESLPDVPDEAVGQGQQQKH